VADDHGQGEAGVPTLLERMTSALGEEKARSWIEAGRVVIDGEIASDPDQAAPAGIRWLISGG
jgi:hypothetical protein